MIDHETVLLTPERLIASHFSAAEACNPFADAGDLWLWAHRMFGGCDAAIDLVCCRLEVELQRVTGVAVRVDELEDNRADLQSSLTGEQLLNIWRTCIA
ncbi:hypothetical protein [Aureliella helgolandensis]|uniref:Uncharacterized protein n=1 Tax=Aureliella helgolandensis TaxID=2527968 RepID=A0A518G865_9BACT|nr:hypothetical protein [Aureliella helgolandensis]QDV24779.1 hypothetical protein Q31a_31010 [Aureliella helgolandensis]